jgi:RimJ/RimL family protein N-acetyltransferase
MSHVDGPTSETRGRSRLAADALRPLARWHHGRALVAAAEAWGRREGCSEFASDADPNNEASIAAHRALGFADVGLIRCFRKTL